MGFSDLMGPVNRAVADQLGGDPVTVIPSTGSPYDVVGNFNAAYVHVDVGTPGVSSSGPSVFLVLSDLTSNPSDDPPTFSIYGRTYRVNEVQPDGQDGVRILLHKVV